MNNDEKKYLKKILDDYKIKKEEALDVGCGPKEKITADNNDQQAFTNRLTGLDKNVDFEPDIVLDFSTEAAKLEKNKYKLVLLSHMLEDCENPYDVLRSCNRILRDNGLLVIIQPYRGRYPRIGSEEANPGHRYDFEPYDVLYMVERTFYGKYKVINRIDDLSDRSFGLVIKKLNIPDASKNFKFPGIRKHYKQYYKLLGKE